MIRLCANDVKIVESYIRTYGLQEYSAMLVAGVYAPILILLSMLPGQNPTPISFAPSALMTIRP